MAAVLKIEIDVDDPDNCDEDTVERSYAEDYPYSVNVYLADGDLVAGWYNCARFVDEDVARDFLTRFQLQHPGAEVIDNV